MQGDPVHDRAHAELAHTVIDVIATGLGGRQGPRGITQGQVGTGEVRGAADQFRQFRRVGVDRLQRGLARGRAVAGGLALRDEGARRSREARRKRTGRAAQELRRELRVSLAIALEALVPGSLGGGATLPRVPPGVDFPGNHEGLAGPAQGLARRGDLLLAQGGTVRGGCALLVRRPPADHGTAADQRGPVVLEAGDPRRVAYGLRVVPVDRRQYLPAIGFEAGRRVIAEPPLDLAIDGNAVVVIEHDELAQAQGAGEGGHLVRDTLHQAAVTREGIGVVIDDRVFGPVEPGGKGTLSDSHAHGVRQALTEGAGRGLDPWRIAILGMARRSAVQLTEVLQFLDRQVVAGEVQQGIDEHRSVPVRQHEAIAVNPGRVARIVREEVVPQDLGDIGHPHRRPGMAAVGLLNRIHGQRPDGVGELLTGRHGKSC